MGSSRLKHGKYNYLIVKNKMAFFGASSDNWWVLAAMPIQCLDLYHSIR
jgi:hypothetical protein